MQGDTRATAKPMVLAGLGLPEDLDQHLVEHAEPLCRSPVMPEAGITGERRSTWVCYRGPASPSRSGRDRPLRADIPGHLFAGRLPVPHAWGEVGPAAFYGLSLPS